jgi:putative hydrolase of the HAD superfamily
MGIEAVVFDYGGVLSEPPFDLLLPVEAELGLPPGRLRDDLQHGVALADAELGLRTTPECFIEWIGKVEAEHSVTIDPMKLVPALRGGTTANEATLALVARLHGRYRLAILTNNIADIAAHWRELVGIDRFEVVIDSHLLGIRKPDPAIYELLLEQLGLPPEAVAFVDDTLPNVVAADELGIHGIHFTSTADLEARLVALGVDPGG